MKKSVFLVLLFFRIFSEGNAQQASGLLNKRIYTTTNFEFIFSFANTDSAGKGNANIVRFTCFFHLQEFVHWDPGKYIGFFSGGAIRNVGFIFKQNDITTKMRSYTLGIPIGIKIGNLEDNFYIYGGAEIEYLFWFKQKIFKDNKKTIYDDWFSNRTNIFIPSVFAGIQFPKGINIKFKYYLDNFLNPDFTEYKNGVAYKPYQNWDTHIFYVSVSFNFKNKAIAHRGRKLVKGAQTFLAGENKYAFGY